MPIGNGVVFMSPWVMHVMALQKFYDTFVTDTGPCNCNFQLLSNKLTGPCIHGLPYSIIIILYIIYNEPFHPT